MINHLRKRFFSSHIDKVSRVLSPGCLDFLENLNDKMAPAHKKCLELRSDKFKQNNYNFRSDTEKIREGNWVINNTPKDLLRRHVELTGPGNDAKMVINSLNSDADGYMLDLEDSMAPTFKNVITGHHNIIEAYRDELIDYKYDSNKNIIKKYKVHNLNKPYMFVRTRGMHMYEENVKFNGKEIPAPIFDIGVYLYHNGRYLLENNRLPYLYIPKLESYEDAVFINDLLNETQKMLDIPSGTTKVTALIETFPSIFEVDEIIYGLKDHIVGLNCGRWDYLFSFIKCNNNKVLADRDTVNMDKPFLENYVKMIVDVCHKRNIHAMGGMSAFIPTKDAVKNKVIIDKIKTDKSKEIERGCDGAWVAHPGLICYMKDLFNNEMKSYNQLSKLNNEVQTYESLTDLGINNDFTLTASSKNISICLQYISAWISGNGAVAINNMMEDLATSEISIFQIKQWLRNEQLVTTENHSQFTLTKASVIHSIDSEYDSLLKDPTINNSHLKDAKEILMEYLNNDSYHFLPEVAGKYLNKDTYTGVQFSDKDINMLQGSRKYMTGIDLTRHRGNFLNRFLYKEGNPAYKYLGTSNGVSAVNVVAGGRGVVGPYVGGWQTNAMKNRLGMLLPDTLHVSPEESAQTAEEINNHLHKADCIQHLNHLNDVSYYDISLLADMEQGWNTPEKVRISVKKAIENGVNVIHIEDQGDKKRCGHLGDKELNTWDDYAIILKSANLAAQEILGAEQVEKNLVRFVARTDALSAKRIHNSANLKDKNNDEHKFIDWARGPSADGKYLYLKQGSNPKTNRSWGLDLSIERAVKVVDQGLASHVWMETPDADLHVAKEFLTSVNSILEKRGKKAYGLYNHSPSFDWDLKFFADAEELANKLNGIIRKKNLKDNWDTFSLNTISEFRRELRDFIVEHGDEVKGDHLFSEESINKLISSNINYEVEHEKMKNYLEGTKSKNISSLDKIKNIIVDERLTNFGTMLSSFGFNLHLTTLPEFHVTAFNMHKLSEDFSERGIQAFVESTQRPERLRMENDSTYTYYKHQTATGTGVEAEFNKIVGIENVNILSDSTEADDLKNRK